MAMANKEIEIKVRLQGVDKLVSFLQENATYSGEDYQKDVYYSPAHRNFLEVEPVAEWLRVRGNGTGSVTYKKWHYDESGKSNYCDEYETEVGDTAQFAKILEVLDFNVIATVEKTRRSWRHKDYEVSIDSVTDLGDFVEVEYKGDEDAEPAEVTSRMVAFLRSVGCTKLERNYTGYPFLVLYPDRQEFEPIS